MSIRITARIEVLTLESIAIVKLIRTKKFKALQEIDQDAFSERLAVYEDRYFELQEEVGKLTSSLNGNVQIWSGIV